MSRSVKDDKELYEIMARILKQPDDVIAERFNSLRINVIQQACNDYIVCQRCQKGSIVRANGEVIKLTPDGEKRDKWIKYNVKKDLPELIEFFTGPDYRYWVDVESYPALSGERVLERLDDIVEDVENFPGMSDIFKRGSDDYAA